MNYNTFINKDLRKRQKNTEKRHPALRWSIFGVGIAVISAVIASGPDSGKQPDIQTELLQINNETATAAETAFKRLHQPLSLPENPLTPATITQPEQELFADWEEFTIKTGDTLSGLFDRANISAGELVELIRLKTAAANLKKIHPGETIHLHSENGVLLGLYYDISFEESLLIERHNGELTSTLVEHNIERRPRHTTGTIDDSLFLAARQAGMTDNLTMELAGIFGWDIDFVLDIRKGDTFSVIYEEIYKNGNKIKDGNILAAEFINQGRSYKAVRYTNPKTEQTGYYTEDGSNMRKAFLRSPVKFTHISSKFTTRRYHPVLHKFRSHKGVDYAAARGTPVRSAGDGKIVFRGKKGGYGKVVIVQHGSRYSTLYAHLNNFNRKARSGARVKQGQVIGYVGSTGLATGPHLHYEFRVNGVHRNPLTVRFPSATPIRKTLMADFQQQTAGLFAQLDVINRNALALNQQ